MCEEVGAWKSWIRMVHALTVASTATGLGLRPRRGRQWGVDSPWVAGSCCRKLPTSAPGPPGLLLTRPSEGTTLR